MPLLEFHSSPVFSGLTGTIDAQNCIIHGCSLITGDMPAEGHDMDVDGTTVTQLHAMAKKKGKVPVLLDHGSGVKDLNGYMDNFRTDGGKLRGDWHLLKAHKETPLMLERAEVMPECFGISAAFKGKGVMQMQTKRKAARAEKLLSFDCVVRPAANASLFSAETGLSVDTTQIVMPQNSNSNGEPTLADLLQAIQGIAERQEAFEAEVTESLNGLQQGGEESDFDTLSRLNGASDADLAQLGLTRGEVDAAVAEYNQGAQADAQAEAEAAEAGGGEGELAGAAAGGAEGGAPQTFAVRQLQRELMQLKAQLAHKDQIELEAQQAEVVAGIDDKITLLSTQRDRLVEFAETAIAENEALRLQVKTGVRPVRGSGSDGSTVRLFGANDNGELHPWQARVKELQLAAKVSEADAIQLADKEDSGALHRDYLISLSQKNTQTING